MKSNLLIDNFKLISIIAIGWNIMGVYAYLMQVFKSEATVSINTPTWYTASFAIAVFTGLAASILLLFKKKLTTSFYMISFIAVLIQLFYIFFISKSVVETNNIIMSILVLCIAFFLLWYSRKMDELAILS